ncbi:MAG: ABC transporter permease [Candidatus Eisenbacteria sp.]|nr:ABC transporter permease [Candidatus Eisenbacteria bacterium]
MGFLLQSLCDAIQLILRLDHELLGALSTTLRVSISSTAIASAIALPLGFLMALREFPGKRIVLGFLRTALALPTVVVGLFVYAFITRHGPLGNMQLLFTQTAIVIGQVLLIIPLITALVHSALQEGVRVVYEEATLLGASPFEASWKVLVEARLAVVTALMTGFGRVVSEVGVSLLLGGNIRGLTRTITTAITLETSQGSFSVAFALGVILLSLVLLVNLVIQATSSRSEAV